MKPIKDPDYLNWIRSLPCSICHKKGPSDAHHVGDGIMQRRSNDHTAVPLCHWCHLEKVHKHPAKYREELRARAKELWGAYAL